MIVATVSPGAYLAAFLDGATLVRATSLAGRERIVAQDVRGLSIIGSTSSKSKMDQVPGATSMSEGASPFIDMSSDLTLMAELASFRDLKRGWDGEDAEQPSITAVNEASRFARVAGSIDGFVPTLHVDGSVILELADDSGSLRFKGDGKIIFALSGIGYGVAPFDGFTVPEALKLPFPL